MQIILSCKLLCKKMLCKKKFQLFWSIAVCLHIVNCLSCNLADVIQYGSHDVVLLHVQGTVLIKSASELKSFSKGEEDQIEQVYCCL